MIPKDLNIIGNTYFLYFLLYMTSTIYVILVNFAVIIWENTSYELRVMSCELLVKSLKTRVESTSSNPRVTSLNLRVMSSNP